MRALTIGGNAIAVVHAVVGTLTVSERVTGPRKKNVLLVRHAR